MKQAILLSFVTAAISFTLSETKLFQPLREAIKAKSVFFRRLVCVRLLFQLLDRVHYGGFVQAESVRGVGTAGLLLNCVGYCVAKRTSVGNNVLVIG